MVESCKTCQEIVAFEKALDRRVEELVQRHARACASVRAENARRWEAFAKKCNGFLGKRFQRKRFAPELLEEPTYFEQPWYKEQGPRIQESARLLEVMKTGHMEHWGEERVQVNDDDPHGPAVYATRARCYGQGHRPFLPDKYDFNSAAGADKFEAGRVVMCATTKRLVDIGGCCRFNGEATDWNVIYWLKTADRPDFLPPRRW